jgi:nitrogen fixation protein FixH
VTMRKILVAWMGLVLGAAACTGGGEDPSAQDGDLDVAAAFDPAPPAAGRNTLVVDVADAAGNPVAGTTVVVDAQMPAHGHGSTEEPVVQEDGPGRYVAFPVTFQMAGSWVVTVTATTGQQTGQVDLEVEIP